MKVGDIVYLKPCGNNARYGNIQPQEFKISKIGRKYFEVEENSEDNWKTTVKFHLDNFREATNYSPDWQLYFSKQEILDEQESDKLIFEIREIIGRYGKTILSLDQLRKIKEIIGK